MGQELERSRMSEKVIVSHDQSWDQRVTLHPLSSNQEYSFTNNNPDDPKKAFLTNAERDLVDVFCQTILLPSFRR